nr:hypothetical protein Itr_chr05CG16940 [Ipomoea trifida]
MPLHPRQPLTTHNVLNLLRESLHESAEKEGVIVAEILLHQHQDLRRELVDDLKDGVESVTVLFHHVVMLEDTVHGKDLAVDDFMSDAFRVSKLLSTIENSILGLFRGRMRSP